MNLQLLYSAATRRAAATLVFWMPLLLFGETRGKTYSVCDVLANPSWFHNRTVPVRGVYHSDWHGTSLSAPECPVELRTEGLVWPTAIDLQEAAWAADEGIKVPFGADEGTIREFETRIRDALNRNPSMQPWVTTIGLVRTRKRYIVERLPSGILHGNGFGPLDKYPAQMIIQTLRDLDLKPSPKQEAPRNQ